MSTEKRFIIRVYGLIISSGNEVLIAEEYHYDTFMRKFPGGGLEFGEGPIDCLKRELMEELQIEATDFRHLHTTDFFAQSAFNPDLQVLGIYYLVSAPLAIEGMFRENYILPAENGVERFRWVNLEDLNPGEITFATDQQAYEKLAALRKKKD
jgi:8-oxo-dGTP diphosphatase